MNVEKKRVFTEIKVIYLREGHKKEVVHRDKVIYLREIPKKEIQRLLREVRAAVV
ncbi:hypothetical protein [Cytobacillus horneckiae]